MQEYMSEMSSIDGVGNKVAGGIAAAYMQQQTNEIAEVLYLHCFKAYIFLGFYCLWASEQSRRSRRGRPGMFSA